MKKLLSLMLSALLVACCLSLFACSAPQQPQGENTSAELTAGAGIYVIHHVSISDKEGNSVIYGIGDEFNGRVLSENTFRVELLKDNVGYLLVEGDGGLYGTSIEWSYDEETGSLNWQDNDFLPSGIAKIVDDTIVLTQVSETTLNEIVLVKLPEVKEFLCVYEIQGINQMIGTEIINSFDKGDEGFYLMLQKFEFKILESNIIFIDDNDCIINETLFFEDTNSIYATRISATYEKDETNEIIVFTTVNGGKFAYGYREENIEKEISNYVDTTIRLIFKKVVK